ncbi:MAG TPA: hypothetical protein ENK90_02155 [Epsilonproteobacteria bacterium]|nr:hypothetical protein [Campylobacterota bacterium]
MKFIITKDLEHSALLNTLMMGVSAALFFYLLFDVVLHGFLLGTDITGISDTLYGNPEAFIEPILIDTLLLQVHIDLFMSLFSLMMLSTIYIRLFFEEKQTKWLTHLLFVFGLASPLLLLVAYFSSLLVVYVWVFAFVVAHLMAMFFALRILQRLYRS